DAVGAARGGAAHHDVAGGVERIAAVDAHAGGEHALEQAEAREDARHVVVHGDAVAFAREAGAPLVHAHAPAALGGRDRREEPAEAGAHDLGIACAHSSHSCYASGPNTWRPPRKVRSTRMSFRRSSAQVSGSSASTTRSATLPGSSEP